MRNGCSDRLSRAEQNSLTAEEVFDLYEGQIDEELGLCGDEELDRQLAESAANMKQAVAKAREMYQRISREHDADEAITALLEDDDELVQSLGNALEHGYYGDLAI